MWWDEYLDAWNRHDGRGVASFMTEDAVYVDVALGERHEGRDDIAAWIDGMASTLSTDYSFEATSFLESGDAYAGEWTMTGTHDRSSPDQAASGRRFTVHGISIGRLENGRIRENTDYWNMLEFLVQIGAMPAPGAAVG